MFQRKIFSKHEKEPTEKNEKTEKELSKELKELKLKEIVTGASKDAASPAVDDIAIASTSRTGEIIEEPMDKALSHGHLFENMVGTSSRKNSVEK